MDKIQQGVSDFMVAAKQTVRKRPTEAPFDERVLRVKLLLEEVLELAEASGIQVKFAGADLNESEITYALSGKVDLALVADSIADISYVNYGAALCYGIDMEPIEEAVQEANMAKFGEGSYKRSDGKWMKPPNWVSPDQFIKDEIERQSV
jgi:predicted HAD superfamily Cof-like phosphohydrolase